MKARKLPTPVGEPVALQPTEPTPFPGASPEPNDELPWEGSDEDHPWRRVTWLPPRRTEAERARLRKPWVPRYLWMETSLRNPPVRDDGPDDGWKYGL